MNKSKILFVLHYPPPLHGASMMGYYIMNSELINSNFECKFRNLSISSSVNNIGSFGVSKFLNYIKLLYKVFIDCLFFKPSLIYITLNSHGVGLIKDSILVFFCKIFKIPHVFHFHNKGVKVYSEKKFAKSLYEYIFKGSYVILLSPLLYQDISIFIPISRVFFIPNGIPSFNKSKKRYLNSSSKFEFLFLSNLIRSKGVFEIIEACSLLAKSGFDFKCVIAGDQGDVSFTELNSFIKKLNLEEFVYPIGKVQNEFKQEALFSADIFLFPSYYSNECFPLVLLEAMQVGLPIISTHEGAIPEIVENGKTGLLVPAQSSIELADAIRTFFENPELCHRMGNAGKEKFQREYTLEKFEDRFLKILKGII